MASLTGRIQALVAPERGDSNNLVLPKTVQDLALEEAKRRSQTSTSNPKLTPIDTTIRPLRRDTLGSPLSGRTLWCEEPEEYNEPNEKQGNGAALDENEQVHVVQVDENEEEEEQSPTKWPIAPEHCRRWGKPEPTIIKRGKIPAGVIHFNSPLPQLPEGWVQHIHLEGKPYYVQEAPKQIDGDPLRLTIVTDSDPRDARRLRGLESIHSQVVGAIKEGGLRLPERVQLFIELYPEGDDWGHVGGYYLADLEHQTIFWAEEVDTLDIGLGDKINFGVFGEQHLKLLLRRQFWYHIECYPLDGSIDEELERQILLQQLTFALLDVSTSPTSTSTYTAEQCSASIEAIEKTPVGCRSWAIARVAGFMAQHQFLNYYGHPSARLSHLHAFEVEENGNGREEPSEEASVAKQSVWRRDLSNTWLWITGLWYSLIAIWLRLCSIFLFDAPIRHHTALEDLFVDKIVYERRYKQIMKTLLDDWSDASLLSTVLWTANMAFLAIPSPDNSSYKPNQVALLQTAIYTCSLFSTIFSVGSITLGLLNTRKHRAEVAYKPAADFLQGAHHRHFGFRPLAIIYALPIALFMWAVLAFAAAIVLYCLMATPLIPRVALLALGAFVIACMLATVWYFWQRETRWGHDVEGISVKPQQRMRIADWFWDWKRAHFSK